MASHCDMKTWDAFRHLTTCPSMDGLNKMLGRLELFKMSLEVPGDIVECGEFQGTGLMLWVKLLHTYCPASVKRVVGFDTFGARPQLSGSDKAEISAFYERWGVKECVATQEVEAMAEGMTGKKQSCLLVSGDISKTAREYVDEHPGARISLLNLDLDLEEPTFEALDALWPIVSRGGIVIFDEYASHRWSESRGVDKFFASHPEVRLKTLPWVRMPSAYCIKP